MRDSHRILSDCGQSLRGEYSRAIQNREQTDPKATSSDQSAEARRDAARTLEELLLCAAAYDRSAGPSADAEEWFRAESESLLRWAVDSGRFLSPAQLDGLIRGFKHLEGGLEHEVYFKKRAGRIFKITKPPHFGHTWFLKDYVQNLIWCNSVFEDDIRIEGVISREETVSLVISQPFIVGGSPSPEQLEEWFRLQNAVQKSAHAWEFPNGMTVADANPSNLLLARDGSIIPIDVHISFRSADAPIGSR